MQLTYMHPPSPSAPGPKSFVEFPKFVHFTDGQPSVIVEDAEQEAAVLAGEPIPEKPQSREAPPAPIESLVGGNDELTMLRKIAADKGIHLDGRWKIGRIRKVVEAASS